VTGRDLSLMVLPFILTVMISFASCSNNKKSEAALAELAPPPPPPPPAASEEQILDVVDELPQFKGGDAVLLKYIAENTTYPEEAKKDSISGKVIVKLVVEKDCSVSNVEVEKSANALLDAEAVRVVSTLPKFEKPGKNAGEAVRVQYMIPVSFKLNLYTNVFLFYCNSNSVNLRAATI
jgi:TonB family protein